MEGVVCLVDFWAARRAHLRQPREAGPERHRGEALIHIDWDDSQMTDDEHTRPLKGYARSPSDRETLTARRAVQRGI